ncbi:nucleotide exchange factor GrpE [Candidatus Acetothermia bacterium]|jgi:molecular chaperone GrpE|nr:nucleotide exchange factor GrpE [Candidatus Acetothermia bacterium]MCI2427251.1 nucleotide exchange factor GrpE [Candidatus Acetothermia bacterium]MCI2428763.1 nucleotide exchange factor GrpE [Candidatus Acetothermia bacterium]
MKITGDQQPQVNETQLGDTPTPTEQDELAKKEAERKELVDRLKRLQADFENYKKRISKEVHVLEERVADWEILSFLPLYDNMRRAFSSFNGNEDTKAFIEGMKKVFAQFDDILRQKAITPIEAVGNLFDPNRHEALLIVPTEKEDKIILEEFEQGYCRSGRVIRPSKVKVGKRQMEDDK